MSQICLPQVQSRQEGTVTLTLSTALFTPNSDLITQDPRRMVYTDAQNGVSVPTVGHEAMTMCVQCPVTRDEARSRMQDLHLKPHL